MKILFIKEKRSPSGIEGIAKYLLYLCKFFNDRGIDYLILYNAKDEFYNLLLSNKIKVKYVRFRVNSPKNIFQILRFKKFIKKILQKKYFTHLSVHFVGLHLLLPKKKNIPYVSFLHAPKNFKKKKFLLNFDIFNISQIIKKYYLKYFIEDYSKADLVLCGSKGTKDSALNYFGVEEKKIVMHNYGVMDYSGEEFDDFRKEFNINEKSKVIISVGRETVEKGVLDFCKVAKILHQKKYKFIFLGGYRDLEFHKFLEKKYAKYVTFAGMRNDVNSFYKYADLHLFLSHSEALGGNAVLETLSFGLPLVAWDVIGVNEVLIDNHNGLVSEFGNLKKIVNDVNLLMTNKVLYKKISQNCIVDFNKKYSIQRNGYKIIDIYKNINKS